MGGRALATNDFQAPDNDPLVGPDGRVSVPWSQWFARVHRIVSAVQSSGTTANRPTTVLWIGRTYFDTTLGKPVWVKAVQPTVWVDGVGTVS